MLEKVQEREGRWVLPLHEVPEGICPYCETRFNDPLGGWREVFHQDPYAPEPLYCGDIHVKEWNSCFFRACENCNPEGERWPSSLTVRLFEGELIQNL